MFDYLHTQRSKRAQIRTLNFCISHLGNWDICAERKILFMNAMKQNKIWSRLKGWVLKIFWILLQILAWDGCTMVEKYRILSSIVRIQVQCAPSFYNFSWILCLWISLVNVTFQVKFAGNISTSFSMKISLLHYHCINCYWSKQTKPMFVER